MQSKRLKIVRLSPSLFVLTHKSIQGMSHNFSPFLSTLIRGTEYSVSLLGV